MKVERKSFFVITMCLATFLLCCAVGCYAQQSHGIRTVVIDAGHGGKDSGAVGKVYKEKDIVLKVALRFGELIKQHHPDVKVVYTRDKDIYLELSQRTDIANKAHADLFISIHANSFKDPKANGTETFVMGYTKSKSNLDVAMKENDVIVFEDDYSSKYQGYNPGSAESFIMFSMMQYANQEQSLRLAAMVQKQYNQNVRLTDRGVKEAPFLVLWRSSMPSILTEIGFISNAEEEKLIGSNEGIEKYARCLFNAFSEYKGYVEGKSAPIQLAFEGGGAATPSATRNLEAQPAGKQVVYKIQICSSGKKLAKNSAQFKEYRGKVEEIKVGTQYKYYVGECATYREAAEMQAAVRRSIPDAFMVAFSGDEQIPVGEARKITN